jgi:serine phosphatase RsbU (regulator of sigma subunit)
MSGWLIVIICVLLVALLMVVYNRISISYKLKSNKLLDEQRLLEKHLSEFKTTLALYTEEKEKFELEKNKVQEKNKKIWTMSETVYKEKKRVDEQLELLRTEKEKLEAEKKKVDEKVKKLWTQSMAIHKEKEKINEIKIEIEIAHREVMDSVTYAKRIQEAVLPSLSEIAQCFPHSFVLFKPRNIVSGDFYWHSLRKNKVIIASVDCTGHGVPGAFMSLIGNTLLNHIVNEKGITDPAEILNQLNKEVNHSLHQTESGSQSRDGMDIALCVFDQPLAGLDGTVCLQFAGANRPLYYVKENVLEEIKADKFPIGGLDYNDLKNFTTQTIMLSKGSTIYISTDGYADQFGVNNKKLKTKRFKEILLSIQNKSMEEQKAHLDLFIEEWKGTQEQTDDILVMGIKV